MQKNILIILLVAVAITTVSYVGCHRKKEDAKAIVLLPASDTTKVTIVYKSDDHSVLWADGFFIQTGLKALNSPNWASPPQGAIYDTLWKKFTGKWISINTR